MKQTMLEDLRAIWKRNPDIFEEIMREYQHSGKSIFPADKRRRVKRQKNVLAVVWASVEFLMWRDHISIALACERMARHGMPFTLYDTPSGMRSFVPLEPEPKIFKYSAEGEKGKTDGENIRQSYYAARRQPDMGMSELWLDQMKSAYNGEDSALDETFLEKAFPPV